MSKSEDTADAKPKKGKGMILKLLAGVVLIGAGGGGVFGLVNAGLIGGGGGHHQKEDNKPRLIRKGEEDPYAPKAEGAKEGDGPQDVDGEGGSEYRTTYFNFTEDFTSNLKDSQALVQMSLAASTRRDGRVLRWMKKHELAIRSALLSVLADTPEQDVYTVDGKNRMQVRMTAAINKVLTDTEGFGGVDQVYFKSFLVQ
jgi:flagellar FliL protein